MGHHIWPVGQAVKTPPFHGGIGGSIPPPVTKLRALSSAGRASALQAECQRFDPVSAHHVNSALHVNEVLFFRYVANLLSVNQQTLAAYIFIIIDNRMRSLGICLRILFYFGSVCKSLPKGLNLLIDFNQSGLLRFDLYFSRRCFRKNFS